MKTERRKRSSSNRVIRETKNGMLRHPVFLWSLVEFTSHFSTKRSVCRSFACSPGDLRHANREAGGLITSDVASAFGEIGIMLHRFFLAKARFAMQAWLLQSI
ncbi:MAG: hypothetical protein CL547_04150 [Alcanivorax sp.]|nr:hypothetical protein [Alcanivorax sp.]